MNLDLDTEQLKLLHDIVLEYRDSVLDLDHGIEVTNILNLIKDALEIIESNKS